MSIEITTAEQEVTAYDKRISFTHEGKEYYVLLHWDSYDGYDLTFLDEKDNRTYTDTPEWAQEWPEDGESLEFTLDSLSDEVTE